MNFNLYDNTTVSSDYVITTPDITNEPEESLGMTMFKNMKLHDKDIAQIDAKTGEKDTFGDLLVRSVRTALHMSDRGITRDHVISICSHNHLDVAIPWISTQFLGAKMSSVDPSFSLPEMNHLLCTVTPRMIFANSESVLLLEESIKQTSLDCEIVVFGQTKKHLKFCDFIKSHPEEETFQPVKVENLKDTALIYFSSGTTGLPKGICLNHYGFLGHNLNTRITENVDMDLMNLISERISFPLTYLCYTSMYWVSAGTLLLNSILEGQCRLVVDDFDGKEIWNLIQTYKPMVLMMTPVHVIEMLAHPRTDIDVSSVITIIIIDVYQGYGQTEVCGPVAMFNPLDKYHRAMGSRIEKIDSVGLPVRGTSYKVVDTETNKNLGPHQQGELHLKSKFVMNGYHNVDSSETFSKDGWLKTGDIVYYDEDLCFYIVDRIKEAFRYRGWFIAPTVLEGELMKHAAVKFAVVIGIPHDDGHHAMGLVVLHEGADAKEAEIEKFVEERVPERQRLRAGVKFIKHVPVTVTGKLNRRLLKEMVLGGKL